MDTPILLAGAVYLCLLAALVVFFLRLRYVIQTNIVLWGVYLCVATLVLFGMGELTYQFLLPSLPKKSSYFLIDNLLIVAEVFCVVSVYQKHQKISDRLVTVFGILFLILWLGEFWHSVVTDSQNKIIEIDRLRITPVFWRLAAILGIAYYFVNLYQKQFFRYTSEPFFWLAVGWFVEYTLTSTSFFQEIKTASLSDKERFVVVPALGSLLGNVGYLLAFWKAKKRVQQRQ